MTLRLLLAASAAAVLLSGCAGQSCDELADMRAERDAARVAYLELARSGTATDAQTEQADTALHRIEQRVHAVEQSCDG